MGYVKCGNRVHDESIIESSCMYINTTHTSTLYRHGGYPNV